MDKETKERLSEIADKMERLDLILEEYGNLLIDRKREIIFEQGMITELIRRELNRLRVSVSEIIVS